MPPHSSGWHIARRSAVTSDVEISSERPIVEGLAGQGHVRAKFYLGPVYDFGSAFAAHQRAMFGTNWQPLRHEVAQYNLALGIPRCVGVPALVESGRQVVATLGGGGRRRCDEDLGYCVQRALAYAGIDGAFAWYLRAARKGVIRAHFTLVCATGTATA